MGDYDGNNYSSIQDKWLLSMDSQNHIRSYHSDGSLEDYDGGAGFISGLTSININNGNNPTEYSNWNCAEEFYNRRLTYSNCFS